MLEPGQRHVVQWNATSVSRSGAPGSGSVYYQIAVFIDGHLEILGALSNVTIHE